MKERIDTIKKFIADHKLEPIVNFLIFAVIVYAFHWLWWNGGLQHYLEKFAFFNETQEFMAHMVAVPSAWIVEHILQYPVKFFNNTIYTYNNSWVEVEGACSGLKQFYQWFFLMLLFPGPWKKKLWFIPLGFLAIHAFNIIRIVILVVVIVHWPKYWNFIHLDILRPMYYLVMFLLWVWWVEKFKDGKKKTN